MNLVVATRNAGKLEEFKTLASGLKINILSLPKEIGDLPEETGNTFEENAIIKAKFAWKLTGKLSIGDDSGLEVDFLDGEPGIFSARYSTGATDASNIKKLLGKLKGVPNIKRTARFKCCLAAHDGNQTFLSIGTLDGIISENRQNNHSGMGLLDSTRRRRRFYLGCVAQTLRTTVFTLRT